MLRSRRDPQCEEVCREVTRLEPTNAEAFWLLGSYLAMASRPERGRSHAATCHGLPPDIAEAHSSLGDVLTTLGRLAEAEAAYRQALALNPALRTARQGLAAIRLVPQLYDAAATPERIYESHAAWGRDVAFGALTPGRQRGYLLYFSSAKQSQTRMARIEKCMPRILEGKGWNE